MGREIELKLELDPEDAPRVLRHPLVLARAAGRARRQQLFTIYYDTPDWRLQRQRAALRLRKVGRGWVQTVKTAGQAGGGLSDRPEWEVPTTAGHLQLDAAPAGEIQRLFADRGLRAALVPMFTTAFTRSAVLLEWPGGDRVELALDRGEVRAEARVQPLCELELELKAGRPARLFEVARELCAALPLRLSDLSKAARGHALATRQAPAPFKAGVVPLAPQATVGNACLAVLAHALGHLQAHADGAMRSDAPEFVHQLRVGVRRLRSALELHEHLVTQPLYGHFITELRWLGAALGPARNWDVFMDQTLPAIRQAVPDDAGLDWLASQGAAQRRLRRTRLREVLGSVRMQLLILGLGQWLAEPRWDAEAGARAAEPAPLAAAAALQGLHERIKRRGRSFPSLDLEARHDLRIDAKRLRHAAELFAPLFAGKRTGRYLKSLVALQDQLGELNDAATTAAMIQALAARSRSLASQRACGLVMGWLMGRADGDGRLADAAWQDFAACKRFWRKPGEARGD